MHGQIMNACVYPTMDICAFFAWRKTLSQFKPMTFQRSCKRRFFPACLNILMLILKLRLVLTVLNRPIKTRNFSKWILRLSAINTIYVLCKYLLWGVLRSARIIWFALLPITVITAHIRENMLVGRKIVNRRSLIIWMASDDSR